MRFDSHAHLAPHPDALDHLITTMDANEIEAAIVVCGGGITALQPSPTRLRRYDNIALLKQCETRTGRLFPFYFANPHVAVDQYRTVGSRFFGLKFGPIVHGVPFLSPQNLVYLEAALDFGHPVYAHCMDKDGLRVTDFVAMAKRHPQLTFILGHGGVGHIDFGAVDLIAPHSRILFETSGTFLSVAQYACDKLGAARVLFGSEHPLQSARSELHKILDLRLDESQIELVLGKNIALLVKGVRP